MDGDHSGWQARLTRMRVGANVCKKSVGCSALSHAAQNGPNGLIVRELSSQDNEKDGPGFRGPRQRS